MNDDPQLGFAGMGLDPTPEQHVRNVMLGAGPWPATDLQRELLRILLYHSGAQRAISLQRLIEKLVEISKLAIPRFVPVPSEREVKDAIRSLVVDFKVRVGASRKKPFGYFLITSVEEAIATANLYISEIIELALRARVLLDPHDLREMAGQQRLPRWIDALLAEPDGPKEAA